MERLTGSPIGGKEDRKFKRAWEDAAAAMPQPLSNADKELLRAAYIQGYNDLGILRTRDHATEAVKNIKKKASGLCCDCPRFSRRRLGSGGVEAALELGQLYRQCLRLDVRICILMNNVVCERGVQLHGKVQQKFM